MTGPLVNEWTSECYQLPPHFNPFPPGLVFHSSLCPAPLPVGMYNTLLQVYQENGHQFNAVEFLEDMEQAGVMPNQVPLVCPRNILGYCLE